MLKTNKPLQAKTPLKATAPIKRVVKPKVRKRTTLQQKTAQQLIKPADEAFSRYIRLRDAERQPDGSWVGKCIDGCGRKLVVIDADGKWKSGANNGHFISRGIFSLRYDELNTNLQSAWCNAWRDKQDMVDGYTRGLRDKYGDAAVKELQRLAKLPDAYKRQTKAELLEIIHDSNTQVDWYLTH